MQTNVQANAQPIAQPKPLVEKDNHLDTTDDNYYKCLCKTGRFLSYH